MDPVDSARGVAGRLMLARMTAWTLLLAGWLALGALGRQWAPLLVAGLAPLVLWLAVIGAALASTRQVLLPPKGLRLALLGCGAFACAALWLLIEGSASPPVLGELSSPRRSLLLVMLAAAAWAVLLVLASRVVKGLRQAARQQGLCIGSPALPALGAALITASLPDLFAPLLGGLLLLSACLLAALADRSRPAGACASGLFDCALPFPQEESSASQPVAFATSDAVADRRIRRLARWTMLPMMASLAWMVELCAGAGLSTHAVTWIHLLAMLGPAAALEMKALARRASPPRRVGLAAAALVAGGVALVSAEGVQAWMLASVAHALAWGLVWSAGLAAARPGAATRPAALPIGPPPGRRSGAGPRRSLAALVPAALVLLLGAAIEAWGLAALGAVHLALAGAAAFACGVFALRLRGGRAALAGG